VVDGGLVCEGGTITEVFSGAGPAAEPGWEEIDAERRFVLPGAIDPHVQLYPVEDWGHYATETGSAALGGVTTIVKMHRDLDGYDAGDFWAEVAGAEGRAYVDFCFHLALMSDAQIAAVPYYARELELTSFKLFMAYKGEEGYRIGIQGVDDGQLYDAFAAIAGVGGIALVHCENQDLANRAYERVLANGRDGLRAFEASRPRLVEAEAVRRAAFLANAAGCPLYVVHVSAKESLDALAEAKRAGWRVTVETESHYLTETADSPAGALAKVIPPVREEGDLEALWSALAGGLVETVGSDHVAASRERKRGSIWDAQLGFPGIATILPVLLSEGVNAGRISLAQVVAVTSANPARILGLPGKGTLLPGMDADLVVVDLDLERVVAAEMLGSASDFSIYEGRTLRGWPVVTVCRGAVVMQDGELVGREGHGRYLRRGVQEHAAVGL
jgi:dihydropyrimidinase